MGVLGDGRKLVVIEESVVVAYYKFKRLFYC